MSHGAKPSDLLIQPKEISYLEINPKVAEALRFTAPALLLAIADKILEWH